MTASASPSPSSIQPMRLPTRRTMIAPRVAYTRPATVPPRFGYASPGTRSCHATTVRTAPTAPTNAVLAQRPDAARRVPPGALRAFALARQEAGTFLAPASSTSHVVILGPCAVARKDAAHTSPGCPTTNSGVGLALGATRKP